MSVVKTVNLQKTDHKKIDVVVDLVRGNVLRDKTQRRELKTQEMN